MTETLKTRPFASGTRTMYYTLAGFIMLMGLTSAYSIFRLGKIQREMAAVSERSAAQVARVALVEEAAGDVNQPGNDVFSSGDTAAENARLQVALARFRNAMKASRADARGDAGLLTELEKADRGGASMSQHALEIFRLFNLEQIEKAAARGADLANTYSDLRRHLARTRTILRDRQVAEFRQQLHRGDNFERAQAVSLAVTVVLIAGLVAYGRRLDREVLTSREREQYVAELDARSRELIHKQQFLSEAQRVAHLGAWEWDIVTGLVMWSEQLYRLFGAEAGVFEPSYAAYIEFIVPADRDRIAAGIAQAVADCKPFAQDYEAMLSSGERRFHRSSAHIEVDARTAGADVWCDAGHHRSQVGRGSAAPPGSAARRGPAHRAPGKLGAGCQ